MSPETKGLIANVSGMSRENIVSDLIESDSGMRVDLGGEKGRGFVIVQRSEASKKLTADLSGARPGRFVI